MMYPHVMRLREPWRRCAVTGAVRHERGFNCPTGLDAREQVWVVIEGVRLPTEVNCNGQALGVVPGDEGQAQFDVTSLLQPRNQLQIDVTVEEAQHVQTLLGEVRLEIRLGPPE